MKKLLLTLGLGVLSIGAYAQGDSQTVTIEVNSSNGALDVRDSSWRHIWTSNVEGKPIVTVLANNNINNIQASGTVYDYRSGNGGTQVFTVSTTNLGYYVSKIEFDAYSTDENKPTVIIGAKEGVVVGTSSDDLVHYSETFAHGTTATFTVSKGSNDASANKECIITNFTVTLALAPWTGPQMTTDPANPRTYYIATHRSHASRGKTMALAPATGQIELKTTAEWEALEDKTGLKWYFVEDTSVSDLMPAIKAVKIYNAAHTDAPLSDPSNGTYSDQTWYIVPNGDGFAISNNLNNTGGTATGTSWNDYQGSATLISYWKADDAGSVWDFTFTEATASAEEIAAFTAAKNNVVNNFIPHLKHYRALIGDVYYNAEVQPVIDEIEAMALPENPTSAEAVAMAALPMEKINACYATIMPYAHGRVIYLKNVRRSEANGKYLTATSDNHINTVAFPTAESSWVVEKVGNNTFRLFSPEKNAYIQKQSTSGQNGQLTLGTATDAAVFMLAANTSGNPGTAVYQTNVNNTSYGINVDTGNSNAVAYAYNDGGSSWTVELAGMTAEQAAAAGSKYVRIRSMRSLHNSGRRENGSLLGVNTVVDNDLTPAATVLINNQKKMGFGTIWKLEPASTGKYHIVNVASQFENQDGGNALGIEVQANDNVNLNVSAVRSEWEIVNGLNKASGGYAQQYTNGLILKSGSRHVDVNNGNVYIGCWGQVDATWPGNGGLFIVEEVGEAEYNALFEAYKAAAKTASSVLVQDAAVAEVFGDNTLFDADALVADINAAMPECSFEPATVLATNSLYTAAKTYTRVATEERIADVLKTADGKHFFMQSRRIAGAHDHSYVTADYTGSASELDLNSPAWFSQPLRGVWQFEADPANEGYYFLRHHVTGAYIKHPGTTNGRIAVDGTAEHSFKLHYGLDSHGFGFSTDGSLNDDSKGIHVGDAPTVISWKVNATESWFDLAALDTEVSVEHAEHTPKTLTFTFGEGVELTPNDAYAESFKIIFDKVVPEADENVAAQRRAASATDGAVRTHFEGNELIVDFAEPGDYTMNIPAGFFRQADASTPALSAPVSYDFTVNGTADGIEEVTADGAADAGVYDLQGRKLAAPVKGINIIGGRKVLVK